MPERRLHDPRAVHLLTAPGGSDRHVHCCTLDERGLRWTTPGPDGHVHRVTGLDVHATQPGGHTHELSGLRCHRVHDGKGRHDDA